MKATATKTGERRAVFDSATPGLANLECHITTISAGEVPHAPHRHAAEEVIVVKEGSLEALQGDKTNFVGAGGIIFEASNEFHGFRNPGPGRATYYVFKILARDGETAK